MSIGQFCEALELIESYVFRRAICEQQTRGYWTIFASLAYAIDVTAPVDSLKVGIARLPANSAFPTDKAFRAALEENDIYHKRVCFDLLDRLENHGTKEPTDTSSYSIEHILPQNEKLSVEWRKVLGENWREIQREWLHRLGNLTLTGYNSTYSDRSFDEKKTIRGGFSDSSVRLNRYVREQSSWTQEEIKARNKKMASRAVDIWPSLVVEEELIDEANEADMRDKAKRRDVGKVPMSPAARNLFNTLRTKTIDLGPDIIELAEQKTVSYHGPAFFLEILPRKNCIGVLLGLDYDEAGDSTGLAEDTSNWKFLVNAQHDGGVYLRVDEDRDIENAIPLIKKAFQASQA